MENPLGNGGFNGKITDEGAIFHGYVKLPEGKISKWNLKY